jgi:hypothetical protein
MKIKSIKPRTAAITPPLREAPSPELWEVCGRYFVERRMRDWRAVGAILGNWRSITRVAEIAENLD